MCPESPFSHLGMLFRRVWYGVIHGRHGGKVYREGKGQVGLEGNVIMQRSMEMEMEMVWGS